MRESTIRAKDTAAVFGTGPIRLMLVEALRAAGARQTYVVEPPKEHRTKALELGATQTLDPIDCAVAAEIRVLTSVGGNVAFAVTGGADLGTSDRLHAL